ncbi:sensor histidine kinase [Microbacterium azadirachtae]|uniref:sensor histidine kinase n=1 Tax=Microbacterium azadirachtae TaxID=582680 RepID=UPI0008849072|nr:PAS domain-containing sensor histidine kinase [Microbacterium azadirachtae]UXW85185.1 PAS domain-containing sensor histidine kinase [Microbacterium azadirachtae]SDM09473.1 PAS domain S-box-containing protein [Microbacterium azadirachtae]SEG34583.1 PAS domain S-box-containing protein [Microbacterium azadirachtae]SEG37243.1 PAS domain S-box-containing protein [Microbacterium azadirachtae]
MSRRASIWRWQLIFVSTTVAIAVLVAALKPTVFATPLFTAGLLLSLVATIVVLVLPWDRIPPAGILAVPMVDIVAIGLTTQAPDIRLGFLWVIPITWIATYYSMIAVFGGIALITAFLFTIANQTGLFSDVVLRVLITAFALGFLGTTIRIGVKRSRASSRLLRRRSEQIDRIARRAETHERRVTQIIDALDTALVALGDDGVILKMNDAYRRLYGVDADGIALPAPAVEYDDREGEPVPVHRTVLARASRGEQLDGERVWLYDADGVWRALEVSTRPMASDADQGAVTLVRIDDVTAALAAAEERRLMSAILTHELRNPLTAIVGHVDLLLERDDLPARAADQLTVVAGAAERMQDLVTTALDASRPARRVLSEPVDLHALVRASVSSFLPTATAGRIRVDVTGASALLIYGDAFRLRQVIDNLLSNAVKYTAAGGSIVVSLDVADDALAELVVADTGSGMAPADVERLFEPYFRGEQAAHGGVPGTGLGLVTVRDIVTAHGGTVDVHSRLGEGTRMRVRLPRRPERNDA